MLPQLYSFWYFYYFKSGNNVAMERNVGGHSFFIIKIFKKNPNNVSNPLTKNCWT